MKRLVVTLSLFSLLLCAPSWAEGLWTKQGKTYVPEDASVADTWTGVYAAVSVPWLYQLEDTSVGIGGALGIRKHWSGGLVLGAEIDAAYTGSGETPVLDQSDEGGVLGVARLSWLGSARLVAGYSVGAFLPYGTVGWAVAGWEIDWHEEGNSNGFVNGLVWGFGVEARMTERLSLKLDWSRYDFGSPSEVPKLDLSQDVISLKFVVKL